jgi:CDP-4-dehydro-6-deoxyglucose reductase
MPPTITTAKVDQIQPLTDSIIELILTPEQYVPYQAGQYLQIQTDDHFLSYSIANAALGSHKYELHIRHDSRNQANMALFAEIKQKGFVTIRLPLGNCHIDRLLPKTPIIFIAGGTGFAPIKAMIEQLLADADARPFELYWGARSQSDLYMDDKVKQWAIHVKHFSYFSLIPTTRKKETLATPVIQQHKNDLKDYQIVIAGPFDMANSVKDILVEKGALPSQLYSDAFTP